MDYIRLLDSIKKKTVTSEQLKKLFKTTEDSSLFEIIKNLKQKELIFEVKNSKTNGNRVYPIYDKYHIVRSQDSYEAEIKEVQRLNPILQRQEYLVRNPELYVKFKDQFKALNEFFFNSKVLEPISRKERSFEIFGQEKMLDRTDFCSILDKIGLTEKELGFYDTPEYCFSDFIIRRRDEMTLLVCENKDIWFNIRRMMFENGCHILFDQSFDGVVYGSGNEVTQALALTNYAKFMGLKVNFMYWGDIDRAGLSIYLNLRKSNPDLSINLFVPAYEKMLELAENLVIPDSEDNRVLKDDYSCIFDLVSQQYRQAFRQYIQNNKRIPQEIINYSFLKRTMR